MKDKADFANKILLEYAKENGINGRDTTDLSPLEKWLILRLFDVSGQIEQLSCDECIDGQKWSPYYGKYVECDCHK
jgi:hypothetical protein